MFTWGFLFFTKVKSGFSCFNKNQYPCCKSVLHFTCGPEIVALQTRCESKGEENHSAPYPDELCKSVVDVGTAWHEETAARAQIVEKEQLLILWHKRMNTKKIISKFNQQQVHWHCWQSVTIWLGFLFRNSSSNVLYLPTFWKNRRTLGKIFIFSRYIFFSFISHLQNFSLNISRWVLLDTD